jgi:hypothetical protein
MHVLLQAQRYVTSEYLMQSFAVLRPLKEDSWIDNLHLFFELFPSACSVRAYILLQQSDHSVHKDAVLITTSQTSLDTGTFNSLLYTTKDWEKYNSWQYREEEREARTALLPP